VDGVANVDDGRSVAVDASAGVQPPLTADGPRTYASLYDSQATTVAAILFGVLIVGGIQFIVARMYQSAKSEQEYLTRFVTALVALVMSPLIWSVEVAPCAVPLTVTDGAAWTWLSALALVPFPAAAVVPRAAGASVLIVRRLPVPCAASIAMASAPPASWREEWSSNVAVVV
jgi:hypothetical protein